MRETVTIFPDNSFLRSKEEPDTDYFMQFGIERTRWRDERGTLTDEMALSLGITTERHGKEESAVRFTLHGVEYTVWPTKWARQGNGFNKGKLREFVNVAGIRCLRCPGCRETLPVEYFNQSDQTSVGYDSYCRKCNKKRRDDRSAEYERRTAQRREQRNVWYDHTFGRTA